MIANHDVDLENLNSIARTLAQLRFLQSRWFREMWSPTVQSVRENLLPTSVVELNSDGSFVDLVMNRY